MSPLGEFEFIARHLAPLAAGEPGALGLTDDAALIAPPAGRCLVVTMDTLVAGVHFLPGEPSEVLAGRVLGVNLSDLAAMGAAPTAYALSLALPPDAREEGWLARFAGALARHQKTHGLALIGGDTVSTPGPLVVTVTAFGTVVEGRELRRSGARPGDLVVVSGTIGDGALGLLAARGELSGLDGQHVQFLVGRYQCPEPRLVLGQRLIGLAHAAMDVSDGLIADLGHLCRASGARAIVEAARVPLSQAAHAAVAADPALLATVLTGGDDYELLFTIAPEQRPVLDLLAQDVGLSLTVIGRMSAGKGVLALDAEGREMRMERPGFRHF